MHSWMKILKGVLKTFAFHQNFGWIAKETAKLGTQYMIQLTQGKVTGLASQYD